MEDVKVSAIPFTYEVLDNEAIFGEWEGALTEEAWISFQALFGAVNADIFSLGIEDIEEVVWDFQYEELNIEIVLTETEEVEDCGEIETENIIIEIESEYDELTWDAQAGEIVLIGEVEQEDGSEEEFEVEGEFSISANTMEISLVMKYDDEESEEITLTLIR